MTRIIKSETVKIIYLFLVWRLTLFIIAFAAPIFITQFGAKFPYSQEVLISSGLPHWLWGFGNFDGVHYLRIAKDGYAYQYTQAFFPIYPILIKLFSPVTFGNLLLSALFVSNLAFAISLVIFYQLIKKNYDKNIALWSCLFLLSFPTSFYFGAVYTEATFFLMLMSALYLLDKNRILLAVAIGGLSSATRLIGVFLTVALIKGKSLKDVIPLFIIPLGLILYMIYLQIKFDNAFYFLTSQSFFGQQRSASIVLPPQVFWRYLKILSTTSGSAFLIALSEFTSTMLAIALLIIGTKKIKIQWLLFSYLAILTPTLSGTLTSMPRYILMAFPIFITLAKIRNKFTKIVILLTFTILLIIAAAFFTQGYWVA